MYDSDSESGHTERGTDRIYRENPELLGFGSGEDEKGFHPSSGSGNGNGSGGCGCAVFLAVLGIVVLFMKSDAAFYIYVIFALILVFAYFAGEKQE